MTSIWPSRFSNLSKEDFGNIDGLESTAYIKGFGVGERAIPLP